MSFVKSAFNKIRQIGQKLGGLNQIGQKISEFKRIYKQSSPNLNTVQGRLEYSQSSGSPLIDKLKKVAKTYKIVSDLKQMGEKSARESLENEKMSMANKAFAKQYWDRGKK